MTTSAAPAAPGRIEFKTTDPARAIDYLSNAYRATLRVSGYRDGYLFRHSRADGGAFALDEVRMPVDLTVRQEPLESLVIVQIDAGRLERECGNVSERFVSGDVFVDAEPSLPATLRLLEVETQTVVLDLSVLTQVAAASPTRLAGPIRLTSFQPRSALAALQWQRTVTFLRDLLANTEAVAQPLIRGNAARLLAATVLAAEHLGQQRTGDRQRLLGQRGHVRQGSLGLRRQRPAGPPDPATFGDLTPAERAAIAAMERAQESGDGYSLEQSTRPQTIGYGLVD
ncbi:MAG: hypothetical protein QOG76_7749, partial [Pseudonocardiales bacterium]|nr:hypothetical protein [Pseudonocardiales bacterium]